MNVLRRSLGVLGALAMGITLAACGTTSGARNTQPKPAERPAEEKPAAKKEKKEASDGSPTANLLAVDDSVPAAPDVAQRLVGPRVAVEKEMQEVVGQAARPLTRRSGASLDSPLGNLVSDVMRDAGTEVTGKPVDVAFTNKGGLRADLPKGALTRGHILEVMPFDNALVVLELTGEDLLGILDRSSMHGGDPISGVTFRIENAKAVDVKVGDAPLDPARTYRFCTNDYIVDGGGRYESIKKARNINRTGVLIRDALLNHVIHQTEQGKVIDVPNTPRVIGVAPPNKADM